MNKFLTLTILTAGFVGLHAVPAHYTGSNVQDGDVSNRTNGLEVLDRNLDGLDFTDAVCTGGDTTGGGVAGYGVLMVGGEGVVYTAHASFVGAQFVGGTVSAGGLGGFGVYARGYSFPGANFSTTHFSGGATSHGGDGGDGFAADGCQFVGAQFINAVFTAGAVVWGGAAGRGFSPQNCVFDNASFLGATWNGLTGIDADAAVAAMLGANGNSGVNVTLPSGAVFNPVG